MPKIEDENLQVVGYSGRSAISSASKIFAGFQAIGSLSVFALAAPYAITFYLLYKKIFKKRLNRLTKKNVETQIFKVRETSFALQEKIKNLNLSLAYLEQDLEKRKGEKYLETEIQKKKDEIQMNNELLDESLVRLEFLINLKMLIERKAFLKQKGLWSDLNKLSKKNLKDLDEQITDETYNQKQLKDYLETLNQKNDFYNEIVKS
jgi:hypothetical protein